MKHSIEEQTLAFCGILQAAELVRQIATTGQCSRQAAGASIDSLFVTNPEQTQAVYGNVNGVRLGITIAREIASGEAENAMISLQYASGLLRLAKYLRRDQERQHKLAKELALVEPIRQRAEQAYDPSVIVQLADVYKNCISTMGYRIQVGGRAEILKQEEKVATIRALLLTGLRSA
ncbi:MAG: DUF489 family protein, partial [Pseudomonadota bacterium]